LFHLPPWSLVAPLDAGRLGCGARHKESCAANLLVGSETLFDFGHPRKKVINLFGEAGFAGAQLL
jgi:hypothetical protein